jgi:hypothetical protein
VHDLSSLNYDNGTVTSSVDSFTDTAYQHDVCRNQAIHNVELNFFCCPLTWGGGICCGAGSCGTGSCGAGGCDTGCYDAGCCDTGCCSTGYGCANRLNMSYSLGLRYLYFKDNLCFSSNGGVNWGDAPETEIYWDNHTTNQFLGPQLGFYADYCVTNRLLLNLDTKFGAVR